MAFNRESDEPAMLIFGAVKVIHIQVGRKGICLNG
jgi:hypothetical protein